MRGQPPPHYAGTGAITSRTTLLRCSTSPALVAEAGVMSPRLPDGQVLDRRDTTDRFQIAKWIGKPMPEELSFQCWQM